MTTAQRNALLSVYNKDGIVEFATELIRLGFRIWSSGGTAKHLREHGVEVTDIATIVGEPILGHRVVTLSREIHAGLMSRNLDEDLKELDQLGIPRFELLCVDMYPLRAEVKRPGSSRESIIEKTDIGGPAMIRAAAKGDRIVICDPRHRHMVLQFLRSGVELTQLTGLKESLAAFAEFTVADYCLTSAQALSGGTYRGFMGERVAECLYGENAWQAPAGLYSSGTDDPLALDRFQVVEGKPLSYNNWIDIERLLQTATHIAEGYAVNEGELGTAIAVGVKHGNPCGAAAGPDRGEVLKKMMVGDPLAIFGGLVMCNFPLNEDLCEFLADKMLDGIIAPAFTEEAIAMLRRKKDRCRFVVNPTLSMLPGLIDQTPRFRFVRGGFLLQPNYTFVPDFNSGLITKHGKATPEQECDMVLACAIGSTSNSNTVTLVRNGQLIGNGVGQQDRVGAAELAITRALRSGHEVRGAVAYSDSFFPFPDGPQVLIDAGVSAIFTSSGSIKDNLTIEFCEKYGVPLYMVPDKEGRGFFGH